MAGAIRVCLVCHDEIDSAQAEAEDAAVSSPAVIASNMEVLAHRGHLHASDPLADAIRALISLAESLRQKNEVALANSASFSAVIWMEYARGRDA